MREGRNSRERNDDESEVRRWGLGPSQRQRTDFGRHAQPRYNHNFD